MKSHCHQGRVSAAKGFSLLELFVVLALISLLGALALPNLVGLVGSVTRATERDSILDQFAAIGRDALLAGRGYVVYGPTSNSSSTIPIAPAFDTYPLVVPEGWQVDLDRPLRVRPNGVCLGATVTLSHPDTAPLEVVLAAPYCRVATDV